VNRIGSFVACGQPRADVGFSRDTRLGWHLSIRPTMGAFCTAEPHGDAPRAVWPRAALDGMACAGGRRALAVLVGIAILERIPPLLSGPLGHDDGVYTASVAAMHKGALPYPEVFSSQGPLKVQWSKQRLVRLPGPGVGRGAGRGSAGQG
jgi:hypothetical protein